MREIKYGQLQKLLQYFDMDAVVDEVQNTDDGLVYKTKRSCLFGFGKPIIHGGEKFTHLFAEQRTHGTNLISLKLVKRRHVSLFGWVIWKRGWREHEVAVLSRRTGEFLLKEDGYWYNGLLRWFEL